MQQQTRLPDELVVCDDGSTDQTLAILENFAISASFPVRLYKSSHNLGSTKNFEKAIQLCSGHLIALSDQDDIWSPQRLERSEQELANHPQVGMVFSDGEIVDGDGCPAGVRMWPSAQFSPEHYQQLLAGNYDLLFAYRFVTGATVMFRASLREHCLPIPSGWIHDEWLAAMIPAFAELMPIAEPLIHYRQHANQQVGLSLPPETHAGRSDYLRAVTAGESSTVYWNALAANIRFAQAICGRLSCLPLDSRGRRVLARYQAWLQFASFRANMPRHRLRRLIPLLKRYGSYRQHASGVASVVKDLIRSLPERNATAAEKHCAK